MVVDALMFVIGLCLYGCGLLLCDCVCVIACV